MDPNMLASIIALFGNPMQGMTSVNRAVNEQGPLNAATDFTRQSLTGFAQPEIAAILQGQSSDMPRPSFGGADSATLPRLEGDRGLVLGPNGQQVRQPGGEQMPFLTGSSGDKDMHAMYSKLLGRNFSPGISEIIGMLQELPTAAMNFTQGDPIANEPIAAGPGSMGHGGFSMRDILADQVGVNAARKELDPTGAAFLRQLLLPQPPAAPGPSNPANDMGPAFAQFIQSMLKR